MFEWLRKGMDNVTNGEFVDREVTGSAGYGCIVCGSPITVLLNSRFFNICGECGTGYGVDENGLFMIHRDEAPGATYDIIIYHNLQN